MTLPIIAGFSVVAFIVAVVAAVIIFIVVIRHTGWPRKSKDSNTMVEGGPEIVILRNKRPARVVTDSFEPVYQVVPPPPNMRPVSLMPESEENLSKLDLDGQEFSNV